MTRIMFDGIAQDAPGIARIPTAIRLVAGYDDGDYAWSAADWALFPNSVHVHIAVHASTDSGSVLDVETGDATPEEAVNWVLMRRAAGADPSVYCNSSSWAAVRSAFATHDVRPPHYWIAQYDGNPAIPAGAMAKQYANHPGYDVSSVADYWPGLDPAPVPAPAPTEEIEMLILYVNGESPVYGLSGGLLWHIADPTSLAAYQAAGVKQAHITSAELASIQAAATGKSAV